MSLNIIPQGNQQFTLGSNPCIGNGYKLTDFETQKALSGKVSVNHHSIDILAALRKEMDELAETGFEKKELEATLSSFAGMEPWRIGETFAECWLEDNRSCVFPWRTQHDIRALKASLPGTDLIGITSNYKDICFTFGEVKTSSCQNAPPNVVYGNKGLTFQIKSLMNSHKQRRQLIQNLAFRAIGKDWYPQYQCAFKAYLRGKYSYWGMLIRDTMPNQKDLEHSIKSLAGYASFDTPAEFVALYTDLSIKDWPSHCQVGEAS